MRCDVLSISMAFILTSLHAQSPSPPRPRELPHFVFQACEEPPLTPTRGAPVRALHFGLAARQRAPARAPTSSTVAGGPQRATRCSRCGAGMTRSCCGSATDVGGGRRQPTCLASIVCPDPAQRREGRTGASLPQGGRAHRRFSHPHRRAPAQRVSSAPAQAGPRKTG